MHLRDLLTSLHRPEHGVPLRRTREEARNPAGRLNHVQVPYVSRHCFDTLLVAVKWAGGEVEAWAVPWAVVNEIKPHAAGAFTNVPIRGQTARAWQARSERLL